MLSRSVPNSKNKLSVFYFESQFDLSAYSMGIIIFYIRGGVFFK